jgi:hypothetical protein
MTYLILRKAGALRSGHDRHGTTWHAVETETAPRDSRNLRQFLRHD